LRAETAQRLAAALKSNGAQPGAAIGSYRLLYAVAN
jgi:hypothetical protein